MGKWSLAQKFVLFLCIFFIFSDVAFSEGNDAIILPKYFMKTEKEAKKGGGVEKKISGLLQLQIQLKKSYREQPTSERIKAMQRMGMKTAEIDKQLVYIHLKRKLSPSRVASLKEIGVIVHEDSWIPPVKNHPTGYIIASIPIDRLYDVARKSFIIKLETAEQMLLPKNDEAAKSIYANNVWEDYGYSGTGVRVAVLDSGLDTTHKDIPTPVASKDYSNYPSLDDTIENQITEHGTHVTGSALGRGTLSNGKYKGMAYGADLIFLKVGNDSSGGASTAAISSAIRDAVDVYEANIVTMSYGGFNTYNDGSEEECQAVDYAFSKGALVFISAGNEADSGLHYSGTVTAHSTTDFIKITVENTSQASLYFYLNWFDGKGTTNNLDLSIYDADKIDLASNVSQSPEIESSRGTEAELVYFNLNVSAPATFFLKVKNNSNSEQFYHIYSYDDNATFENADLSYTINSPAAADNAIAVASYVTRPSWTDYKGHNWSYSINNTAGTISSFSSRGPRIDGVKKPDIAAPGQGIISARDKIVTWPGSEDDYVIDNDGVNDGEGPADYLLSQGTSMACPIAAGAGALLMESNSSLKGNPESVRNALFQTASNNGEQNNTDGYGYLNVLNALNYIASTTPSSTPTPLTSPTPTSSPTPGGNGFLSGTVYDQDNFPLEGVTVTIIGNSSSDSIDTNEDGYYEFYDLAAGDYILTYEKDGYQGQTRNISLGEGETLGIETITLELIERGSISGHIVNTKGDPVESAKMKLKGVTTKTLFNTSSDADGFFEFTDLDANTYVIIANKKGYKRSSKTVILKEGEEKEIEIKMKKAKKTVLRVTP
ncbi:MAG: S8 family serine peptidase [Planctomycetes bacterium]|uniref:S8 family serine peptidase n=1 Tax=Candidatus Wunengus sp. YC65 TaxID=3367701 RepID=UPI001D29DB41|nr:S8 family serine peptidase [Planctomycetota bacterium]